jgi:hypothetical protein
MTELQKGTPVDLGASSGKYDSPGTGDAGSGLDGRSSQSPLAASRDNADPVNINDSPVKTGFKGA